MKYNVRTVRSESVGAEDNTMQQHTHDPENEQNNDLPAQHISALHTLASDYLELANEMKSLEAKQQVVKDELANLMQDIGITAHKIPGLASLTIRPQNVRYVYDPDALEELIQELVAQNTKFTIALAERIRASRERKTTKSYLMIMKSVRKDS